MEEAIVYYKKQGAPADQSAVTALLREAQAEHGGTIPAYLVSTLAEALGVKESFLLAVIRRIPSLRLADTHCLEICAGPNCGRHAALAEAAEKLRSVKITVKFVPCMRMCGQGPNIRWDGKCYNHADEALLRQLTEKER
ncbi:MAG: NAD(P)H-dependent oxidoreductase subunit E [Oscillospiraceae bacterium]|nr:NAD(P)H-dependent oxidoreductase subunit E [Oscillospiraceae bacterium]